MMQMPQIIAGEDISKLPFNAQNPPTLSPEGEGLQIDAGAIGLKEGWTATSEQYYRREEKRI